MIRKLLSKAKFLVSSGVNGPNNLLKDSLISLAMKLTGAVLSIFITFYMASKLGAKDVGIYYLVFSIISIVYVISRMGLDNIVVRHVAVAKSSGDFEEIKILHMYCFKIILISSIIFFLIIFSLSPIIAREVFNKPELSDPLMLFSFAIVPFVVGYFHGEMFRGMQKITMSQFIQNVGISFLFILMLPIFINNWGVQGAISGYIVSSIIVAIFSYYAWKQYAGTKQVKFKKDKVGELLSQSRPLLWVSVTSVLTEWLPMILLGIWAQTEDVGVYGIAMKIAMLAGLVLLAVNSAVAPRLAKLYKKNDIKGMKKTAISSNKIMLIATVPIFLVIVLFPSYLMAIPGEEFVWGVNVLIVLAVAQFINVLTGSVGTILAMTGHERILWRNALFGAILCLTLCVILIPLMGAMGAAISVASTIIFRNLAAVYYVNKYFNFNMLTAWKNVC